MGVFFPDEPREFPGRRGLKIVLRGVHVLCAGVYTGAHILGAEPSPWFLATLATGLMLLALDLHETAAFLAQIRGLFLLFKLAVLAALPLCGDGKGYVLAALVILSVISSHAPGNIRHRVVLGGGRIKGAKTHG